jgi:hypothetical protein
MPREPKPTWQVIEQILSFAASCGKENPAGIKRSLELWKMGLPEDQQPFVMIPEERTISRIINKDLQELSREAVIEKLPRSVWNLRRDCDELQKLADSMSNNKPYKSPLDMKTFTDSESIITERELRDLLLALELHKSYKASEFIKLVSLWEFFGLEGNRYTEPEVRRLQDELWNVLDRLVIFLQLEFTEAKDTKGERDPEFELSPCGLKLLNDDKDIAVRKSEAIDQLHKLIDNTREVYQAYRAAVRSKLQA